MKNRWLRILRHRLLDEQDSRRALGAEGLARVQARVAASERRHTGEIRVCLEAGLPLSYLWRGASARERAVTMFGKLRVWDTEANNGVLIYVLLAEHAIEIVADRGLARQVQTPQWQAVIDKMREAFRAGRFEEGLNEAIDAVDALLVARFPLPAPAAMGAGSDGANPNELPDAPDLR
jgi:uncharacterized membrane protein